MRLIDADAIKDKANDTDYMPTWKWLSLSDLDAIQTIDAVSVSAIEDLPTIDPVKHGKWILQDTSYWRATHAGDVQVNRFNLKCPFCGWRNHESKEYNYCPNCGAKMEGAKNERVNYGSSKNG